MYKLDANGNETVAVRLHGYGGWGSTPTTRFDLRDSDGNLYGATYYGGTDTARVCVYKLDGARQ